VAKAGEATSAPGWEEARDRAIEQAVREAGDPRSNGTTRAQEDPPTGGADIKGGIRAEAEGSVGPPRPRTPVTL